MKQRGAAANEFRLLFKTKSVVLPENVFIKPVLSEYGDDI